MILFVFKIGLLQIRITQPKPILKKFLVAQMKRIASVLWLLSKFIVTRFATNLIPTYNVQHNLKCYNFNLDRSPHDQVARVNITITVHQLPELYIKKPSLVKLTNHLSSRGGWVLQVENQENE